MPNKKIAFFWQTCIFICHLCLQYKLLHCRTCELSPRRSLYEYKLRSIGIGSHGKAESAQNKNSLPKAEENTKQHINRETQKVERDRKIEKNTYS